MAANRIVFLMCIGHLVFLCGICNLCRPLHSLAAEADAGIVDETLIVLHTVGGKNLLGSLGKISADWSIRLHGPNPVSVAGRDVVSIYRKNLPRPAHPLGSQIVLTNGDRLPIERDAGVRLADERFYFQPAEPLRPDQGAALKLPIPFVAILWLQAPKKTQHPERLLRRLLAEKRKRDVIILNNGDRMEGLVATVNSNSSCRLKIGRKFTEVPFKRIAAIVFNTESAVKPPLRKTHALAVFANGARLTLQSAQVNPARKQVRGQSVYRFALDAPLGDLAALQIRNGSAVYLSDLKPVSYYHEKFFGAAWPYARDASVVGDALAAPSIGVHDKGLGLHNGSRLVYSLEKNFRWFEAWIAVAPKTGSAGSSRIRVIVDGEKEIYTSKQELTAASGMLQLRLDVSGAETLTLRVDYGNRGDVQGHVNWINARLLQ